MVGMPQARIGDYTMGHWIGVFYFPPTDMSTGSDDTISCDEYACRVTDVANEHMGYLYGIIPISVVKHTPMACEGAPCKLIDGLPAFRVGDAHCCGDTQAQGCEEHLVGDECEGGFCV